MSVLFLRIVCLVGKLNVVGSYYNYDALNLPARVGTRRGDDLRL